MISSTFENISSNVFNLLVWAGNQVANALLGGFDGVERVDSLSLASLSFTTAGALSLAKGLNGTQAPLNTLYLNGACVQTV